jgi:hypothetical protein
MANWPVWMRRFEAPQGRCRNDVNAGIVEQGSRRRSTGNRNFRGFGVLAAEGACRELQHQAGGSDRDEGHVESERGNKRRRYVCLVALKHTAIRQRYPYRGCDAAGSGVSEDLFCLPKSGWFSTH